MQRKHSAARLSIGRLCRRLRTVHGKVEYPDAMPVLDELVATILSQNTTDANSDAAFQRLVTHVGTWDAVRRARVETIAAAIRPAGLQQQKAECIQQLLRTVQRERGELSLEFLRDAPPAEAMAYLRRFPGVGPKTAACVLLFACRQPVLPVDTHVHRLSLRLGLVPPGTSANKAHELLAEIVPVRHVLEFHVLLIRHGRRVCHARSPKCPTCPLLDACPEGGLRLRSGDFRPL